MRFQVRYSGYDGSTSIGSKSLLDAIQIFVGEASESGRRAQAVVAGLMDVVAGHERVESGRINDPSRRYPGDVCVRSATTPGEWEKALEVRDKPVSVSDIQIFGKKCLDMNVRDAAIVMASERQEQVDEDAVSEWASRFGLGLTLFHGWGMFVNQALFWSIAPKPIAAARAAERIHQRLVAVEAPPQSVARWHALILESSRRI
jgi:hypothetical protein